MAVGKAVRVLLNSTGGMMGPGCGMVEAEVVRSGWIYGYVGMVELTEFSVVWI